eukprot:CAMPEP_0198651424 /NCGR_PEP_ID=MMETSP1467-20131203/5662_1 /TAXON_ID=1462469 /ORGANISM="unid. sp., Strain CCMP2135" /LENGTH=305 /DNA_ID=CAMNT_0044387311 /DNA_START=30 /DNA_END=947 /DNA_ORIENTATION=-
MKVLLFFTSVLVAIYLRGDADLSLRFVADVVKLKDDAFAGKRVWIVGASTGIGAALAEEYAKRGAAVVLSARSKDKLEAVKARCGQACSVKVLDVLDEGARRRSVAEVDADILVLNAGRSQRMLALNSSLETTQEVMALNFFAPVDVARSWALERGQKGGQIVVTSSLSGKIGTPIGSSYSASKFALHGYFEALRVEVPEVDVTLACPGPVVSDIGKHAHRGSFRSATEADETKMPTQRCAYLMAAASYFRLSEVWISEHPFLFFTALMQYTPTLGKLLAKKIGYKRVTAFQAGHDIFATTSYLK